MQERVTIALACIAELEAADSTATSGPWKEEELGRLLFVPTDSRKLYELCRCQKHESNRAVTVAARNTHRALLEVAREMLEHHYGSYLLNTAVCTEPGTGRYDETRIGVILRQLAPLQGFEALRAAMEVKG